MPLMKIQTYRRRAFPAAFIATLAATGCLEPGTNTTAGASTATDSRPRVAFDISVDGHGWGTLVFELDAKAAPITVANFLRYTDEGYYDGTIIHRITTGPRIHVFQGGGYTALEAPAKPGQRAPIPIESNNGLKNIRGTIAMARDAEPNTATSEYFVNLRDNPSLDYPGRDGYGYCVFGRVVEGLDMLDALAGLETAVNPDPVLKGEKSTPKTPPVVTRAYRVQ